MTPYRGHVYPLVGPTRTRPSQSIYTPYSVLSHEAEGNLPIWNAVGSGRFVRPTDTLPITMRNSTRRFWKSSINRRYTYLSFSEYT